LEFALMRARVQAAAGEARDAQREFEAKIRDQPTAAAWYGLSQASLRVGEMDQAARALDAAISLSAPSTLFDLARAELALARGQAAQAAQLSGAALVKNSAYRPLAYVHVKALLRDNKAQLALDFLNQRQRIWVSDATLYALKAQAHQALGQPAESFLAQAEAYALVDRTGSAIEQLQMAQRLGKADFYTLSIIDARMRELRERQQEETQRRQAKQ
jgi:predicted Zn-dependent protease